MATAIGIYGAGGWGIALARLLAENGERVTLWCHRADSYQELRDHRESQVYLPGIMLPQSVDLTRSVEDTAAETTLVICAVPSHAVREVMSNAALFLPAATVVLCASKGLEEESSKTMGEVLGEVFGEIGKERHAFLSGPTFAIEVARGLPAAVTVAAYSEAVAIQIQEILSTPSFRVYSSKDIVGVQMGGVIKNVIAIAAGIGDGLGLGQNARAALITRGLAEMTRLALAMGADPMTLAGLPGLGDLVLTCAGDLSRNRRVGLQIGQGKNLQEITEATRTVAEGIRNTRSVHFLARRLQIDMPIVEQMYCVLYEGKQPSVAVRDLMQRSLKAEIR